MKFEDFVRDTFSGHSEEPPSGLWDDISEKLDSSFEDQVQRVTSGERSLPPASAWRAISARLAWRQFLQFSPGRFNVYYATGAAALAGVFLLSLSGQPEQAVIENQPVASESQDRGVPKPTALPVSPAQAFPLASEPTLAEKPALPRAPKPTAPPAPETRKNTANSAESLSISGPETACIGGGSVYELSAYSTGSWHVSGNGKIVSQNGQKAVIDWDKAGPASVSFVQKNGAECVLRLSVAALANAPILAPVAACEGLPMQLALDGDFSNAEWFANSQPFGKGAKVSITPPQKGALLIAVRARTSNGCPAQGTHTMQVNRVQAVAVKIEKRGHDQLLFSPAFESSDTDARYSWTINGSSYEQKDVQLSSLQSGIYSARLSVRWAGGCESKASSDCTIAVYKIAVPNAAAPSKGQPFLPVSSGLKDYNLSIYNAQNEKVWETTSLSGGTPAEGWDGTQNGTPLPSGAYTWKIDARFEDGSLWQGVETNGAYRRFGSFRLMR